MAVVAGVQASLGLESAGFVQGLNQASRATANFGSQQANASRQYQQSWGQMANVSRQARASFQQLGFQIQDIAVQLQMGTDPMRVFVQQGSQIASIFGPAGAAVGILVAVLGSLAGSFLGASRGAKDANDAITNLDGTLQGHLTSVDDMIVKYRLMTEEQRTFERTATEISLQKLNEQIEEQRTNIDNLITGFQRFQSLGEVFGGLAGFDAEKTLGIERLIDQFKSGEISIGEFATGVAEFRAEAGAAATKEIVQLDEGLRAAVDTMTQQEEASERLRKSLGLLTGQSAELAHTQDEVHKMIRNTTDMFDLINRERKEANDSAAREAEQAAESQRRFEEQQTMASYERLGKIATDFTSRANKNRYDANIKATMAEFNKMADITTKFHNEAEQQWRAQAEENARLMEEPLKNFMASMQTALAGVFENVLSGQVDSFQDMFDQIKQLAIKWVAEMAALMVFRPDIAKSMFGNMFGAFGAAGGATAPPGAIGTTGQVAGFTSPGGMFIPTFGAAGRPGGIGTTGQAAGFTTSGGQFVPSLLTPPPSDRGFMGAPSGASGVGIGAAGVGGSAAGYGIGSSTFGGGTGAKVGGTIGGGLGAAGGMYLGGPAGAALGGMAGGFFGSFIGSQFDSGNKARRAMIGGGPLGSTGQGPAALFGADVDRQLQQALTASQEAIVNSALETSKAISVEWNKKKGLSEGDKQRIAAARLGPAAAALGITNIGAVTTGTAEQQMGQFQEALTAKTAIDDLRGSLRPLAQQNQELSDRFAELYANASKYGIALDGVAEAQARAYAELNRQQRVTIHAASVAVGAMRPVDQALLDLQVQMEQAAADAQALGISTAGLAQIHRDAAAEISRAYRAQFNAVAELVGAIRPVDRALQDLQLQMEGAYVEASRLGVSTAGLAQAHRDAAAEIKRAYRLQYNAVAEAAGAFRPLDRALADLQVQMEGAYAEARRFGVSTANLANIHREAAAEIVRAYRSQYNAAAELAGVFRPIDRALADLQIQMEGAYAEARRFGISTANLARVHYEAAAEIARAYRLQYNAVAETAGVFLPFDRALADLQIQMEAAYAEARRYGISTANLAQVHRDAAAAIYRQHQAQVDAMALGITNPFEQLIEPLRALGIELNRSLLNPLDQFNASAQNFRDILARALAGNTEAIEQLDEAGQNFIATATSVGASPAQAAATREVQAGLQSVIGTVQGAQAQAQRGVEGAIWGANQRVVDTLRELVVVGQQQIAEMRRLQRGLT